jgi:hypothetical protein
MSDEMGPFSRLALSDSASLKSIRSLSYNTRRSTEESAQSPGCVFLSLDSARAPDRWLRRDSDAIENIVAASINPIAAVHFTNSHIKSTKIPPLLLIIVKALNH